MGLALFCTTHLCKLVRPDNDFGPQAMNGEVSLEEALRDRLRIIDCTPEDLTMFSQAHPPISRLTQVYVPSRNGPVDIYKVEGHSSCTVNPGDGLVGNPGADQWPASPRKGCLPHLRRVQVGSNYQHALR